MADSRHYNECRSEMDRTLNCLTRWLLSWIGAVACGVLASVPYPAAGVAVNWVGRGDGVSWQDPNNWDKNGQLPTLEDDVSLISTDGQLVIEANGPFVEINSLSAASTSLVIANEGFTISQNTSFQQGSLTLKTGTLTVPRMLANGAIVSIEGGWVEGEVVISDGRLILTGGGLVAAAKNELQVAPLPPQFILRGKSFLEGTIQPGQTVWIQGSREGGTADVIAEQGLDNHGSLRLESIDGSVFHSNLTVNNSPLYNHPDGIIEINSGLGGNRNLVGEVINEGTFYAGPDQDLMLNGSFFNSGNMDVFLNSRLDLLGSFTNEGYLQIHETSMLHVDLNGENVFTHNGGDIFVYEGGMLHVERGGFEWQGGTLSPQIVLTDVGITLANQPLSPNPVSLIVRGDSTWTGDIPAGVEVWIQGGGPSILQRKSATLTAPAGFFNQGTLRLETIGGSIFDSRLVVASGNLINAPEGLIQINQGDGGGRSITAAWENQGSLYVDAGAQVTFEGDVSNESLQSMNFGENASATFKGNFTQRGALEAFAGARLEFQLDNQFVFDHLGGRTSLFDASMLIRDGAFNLTGGDFEPRANLFRVDFTLSPEITNPLDINLWGVCAFDGNLLQGQIFNVQGSARGDAELNVARGFSNQGAIRLDSTDSNLWNATLNIMEGGILNEETGIIEIDPGAGGTRTINGMIANRGFFVVNGSATQAQGSRINSQSLTPGTPFETTLAFNGQLINEADLFVGPAARMNLTGVLENKGNINLDAGAALNLNMKDGGGFLQNQGSVNVFQDSVFQATRGPFHFLGGDIFGRVLLAGVDLELGDQTGGNTLFVVNGITSLNGNISTQQTFLIQGGGGLNGGHAVLKSDFGLINNGAIILDATNGDIWRSILLAPEGTIQNNGSIQVMPGTGGERGIVGELVNNGQVNIAYPTTLGRSRANHENHGLFQLEDALVTLIGKSFINQPEGVVQGQGTFGVPTVNFMNQGIVRPEGDPGSITFLGGFTQESTGRIEMEVGPGDPGIGFDQIRVDGQAVFNGALDVILLEGYTPAAGDRFPLIHYLRRFGEFSEVPRIPLPNGLFLDYFYHPNSFTGYVTAEPLAPPVILMQPKGAQLNPGETFRLSVDAAGTGPLRYQWRKNGVKIEGEQGPELVFSSIQPSDAGVYRVIVYNDFGSVGSELIPVVINMMQINALEISDNFGGSKTVAAFEFDGVANNLDATREPGEPNHAGKPGGHSMWLRWMAPATGVATVDTLGSSFDTLLAVYMGSSVDALEQVVANDDGGPFLTSQVQFNAVQGTIYHIAVDGVGGLRGEFHLTWKLEEGAPQVPEIITQPKSQTIPSGGEATFGVETIQQDLNFQWLFNGNPISGATGPSLRITQATSKDVGTYRVAVSNAAGASVLSAPARLDIGGDPSATTASKFQDLFDNGANPDVKIAESRLVKRSFTSVAAGSIGSEIFNNFESTTEPGEPDHGGVVGGASTWFGIIPDDDGIMQIDTEGSEIDTVLAVYTGTSLLDLVLIASDDNSGPDGISSFVEFAATQGVQYLVAVDGVDGATGNIQLNWRLGTPPEILLSPESQYVAAGAPAMFMVQAGGAPDPTYQWRWNGIDLEGETGATLTIDNVEESDLGQYSVAVENFLGVVLSEEAQLGFPEDAPVELHFQNFNYNGEFAFEVAAPDGTQVQIDYSTDLTTWEPLHTSAASGGILSFTDDQSGGETVRFYRAYVLP